MNHTDELISVIVPIYNVQDYLDKCISSIMNQTYRQLEIILVDDGSTDNSGSMCDAYESMDSRVTVIHKQNGGLSSARNCGLEIAKGKYIAFVDSDDYVAEDMYECMLKNMENDVDVVCGGRVYIGIATKEKRNCLKQVQKFTKEQAVEELLLLEKITYSVCTNLYRRYLFDNIRFPEGKVCEDVPVSYSLFKNSRNVIHIGKPKYFYVYRSDSTSRRDFFKGRVAYVLYARDILLDVKKNFPNLEKQAEARYVLNMVYIIMGIRGASNSIQFSDIDNRLKKALFRLIPRILCNPYLNSNDKKAILKIFL